MSSTATRNIPIDEGLFDRLETKLGDPTSEGCREFTGRTNTRGYGVLDHNRYPQKTIFRAHRVAFKKANPTVDLTGLVVMHSCDNPRCCEVTHLTPGTNQENMDDMVRKGRQAVGASIHTNKLTEAEVLEIRERYANGETQVVLGEAYAVTHQMISDIVTRKHWKQI